MPVSNRVAHPRGRFAAGSGLRVLSFAILVRMPTTRLILVRHGQSLATVNGVVGGPTGDTGLTDVGRAQAARLRDRLARTPDLAPDLMISSTLPRAVQTAQIVAPAYPGVPRALDDDVVELRPGEADGMTWTEFRERYGSDHPADTTTPLSPGGESGKTFDTRVRLALYRLTAQHTGRTLLVFTHGGFIVSATRKLLGTPGVDHPRPSFLLDPTNTSLTVWSTDDPDGGTWLLERYNDSAHVLL